MSLLAETLIDEWMNRKGFLTMRGVKNQGVDEIDLLGVRKHEDGSIEGWHVEAQISFRPIGYISKLTQDESKLRNKSRTSAWERPEDILQQCVAEFVENKFNSHKKKVAREQIWSKISWKNTFVHGNVRSQKELDLIREMGVDVIPFHEVLDDLGQHEGITGAAGTDISEIIEYFAKYWQSR